MPLFFGDWFISDTGFLLTQKVVDNKWHSGLVIFITVVWSQIPLQSRSKKGRPWPCGVRKYHRGDSSACGNSPRWWKWLQNAIAGLHYFSFPHTFQRHHLANNNVLILKWSQSPQRTPPRCWGENWEMNQQYLIWTSISRSVRKYFLSQFFIRNVNNIKKKRKKDGYFSWDLLLHFLLPFTWLGMYCHIQWENHLKGLLR